MKRYALVVMIVLGIYTMLNAAGIVLDKDNNQLACARLKQSAYQADIQNQVAIVTVTEEFQNVTSSTAIDPRYYFPLPEGASATQLRWFIDDLWYVANIAGNPPNPGGGPSNLPQYFIDYVGAFPVVFDFNTSMSLSESIIVELSYVQLLPYSFGNVDMILRNSYSSIQTYPLDSQSVDITLISNNVIESFNMIGINAEIVINEHQATANYLTVNQPATLDYYLQYSVVQDALTLTAMSGVFDDLPDTLGDGIFTFIAEPDNTQGEYINKVFTLIIDRSGSMSGDKIVQARDAASYISNNLNQGDSFNLISFNESVTSLWTEHHPFTPENLQAALNYINTLYASGSTNISGAFSTAIPQFSNTQPDVANIIVFFTDGQATAGITNTDAIIGHVNNLVDQNETTLYMFNFGIGADVNTSLLSRLALDNNGIAAFLGNSELESAITEFYDLIRYPVLLSPTFTVEPANAITEVYPDPLPNLYQGKQLIVSGRYNTAQDIDITFSGNVFGQVVDYSYNAVLSEVLEPGMEFLPKIWAKQKIESMLQLYYTYNPDSAQAIALRQQIIDLSIAYGVVCEFTSFSGGEVDNEDDTEVPPLADVVLLGNYPNPFNPSTAIRFEVKAEIRAPAIIRIYNARGQLVRTLGLHVNRSGLYEIVWDGKDDLGNTLSSGMYFYTISIGDYILSGKMTMLK